MSSGGEPLAAERATPGPDGACLVGMCAERAGGQQPALQNFRFFGHVPDKVPDRTGRPVARPRSQGGPPAFSAFLPWFQARAPLLALGLFCGAVDGLSRCLKQEGLITAAADVYSFGIICKEAFVRERPRPTLPTARVVLEDIGEAEEDGCERSLSTHPESPSSVTPRNAMAVRMPEKLRTIVQECLHFDPEQRSTFLVLQRRLRDELEVQGVGAALVRQGQEGRRQALVLQQVSSWVLKAMRPPPPPPSPPFWSAGSWALHSPTWRGRSFQSTLSTNSKQV